MHQKGSKSKDVFKVGIEPRMMEEIGVQNTTAVYSWFGKYAIQLFTEFTNKSTYLLAVTKIMLPRIQFLQKLLWNGGVS